MTHYIAALTIKDGKREEYIGELKHANLVEQFREQHGNVHYFISKSVDDPDVVIVSRLLSSGLQYSGSQITLPFDYHFVTGKVPVF